MANSTDKLMADEASPPVNPAINDPVTNAVAGAETGLPVMDENVKDRTVTIIAIISITLVGLLGLWLIVGAMRSSVSANDEAAIAPKTAASGQLAPHLDKSAAKSLPVSPTTPTQTSATLPAPSAAGTADPASNEIRITGQVAAHKSPQPQPVPVASSAPAALPAEIKAVVKTEMPAATESKTADVLVSEPLVKPRKARPAKQYGVQLGVFNSVANAESLRKKMQAQGVPVVIESRVHIGPFATQAEADKARAKLKAMGIDESAMVILK